MTTAVQEKKRSGYSVLGKESGMCKGPVAGNRIAYSRTQTAVLCREHSDLLKEGRDDFPEKEGGALEISCIKKSVGQSDSGFCRRLFPPGWSSLNMVPP